MRIYLIKLMCSLLRLDINEQNQSTSSGLRTTWVIKKKKKNASL